MTLDRVLIVNAGSSSLKLRILDADDEVVARADLPPALEAEAAHGLEAFLASRRVDAVGHRVVHGGAIFRASVPITDDVRARLRGLVDLAPLHNAPAIAAIEAVTKLLSRVPQIACFDTAFHGTLPPEASTYAVPWEWRERWGIRRFGFHGFSHAYASRRAADLLARPVEELRIVTCHLGAGASLAAVAGGRSVDTTMGFTPLEGLVMATRSGSVDPGALLWIERHQGLDAEALERALEHESGVLGLSRRSADMREVLGAAAAGDADASLAIDVYVHRLRAGIAAMAAVMGGLDALVFTGGVGEASPVIRERAVEGLRFLGVALDADGNEAARDEDGDLSAAGTLVRVLLVHAREDLEIAREVRATVGRGGA